MANGKIQLTPAPSNKIPLPYNEDTNLSTLWYYCNSVLFNGENIINSTSTQFNAVAGENTLIFNLDSNKGYKANLAKIRYRSTSSGTYNLIDGVISNNGLTVSFTFNSLASGTSNFVVLNAYLTDDNEYIQLVELEPAETADVTKTLSHASVTPADNVLNIGTSYNFVINADNNYYFDTAPVMSYKDSGGETVLINLTMVNESQYTATVLLPSGASDVIINAAAVSIPARATVTKNLTHATITPDLNYLNIGENYNITIAAASGFIFDTAPTVKVRNSEGTIIATITPVKVSDYEYTAAILLLQGSSRVTFTATAIAAPETASVTISANNSTVTPNINIITIGNTVNFTFTADNGYIFDIAPVIRYKNNEGSFITIPPVKVTDYEYTAAVTLQSGSSNLQITSAAVIETETSEKYGAIQIHKVTKENVQDFESLHLFRGSGGGLTEIDITQYIAAFKMLFIDVTTIGSDNILVANIDTHITAGKLDNDIIELDLGSFNITGYYGNALDIKYSDIKITLPFIDIVKLDSAKVINKTISVKYSVSVLTGNCIAYIYDITDNNNILLAKYNGNMAFDVPFIKTISGDNKITLGGETNILFNTAPKVTYSQKLKADSDNNIYTTSKTGVIGSETGYFRCKNITIDIATTANEKQQIETLLKSGVYI